MIIEIESACGDKRLVGKAMSFDELKVAVKEIFEKNDEKTFVSSFCARYGYKEIFYCDGYADYLIDLDVRRAFITEYTFPKELDGAKVLRYTGRGIFNPVYYSGGAVAHNVAYLAICKYDNDEAYYVFHCDENLQVVADDCFESAEVCEKYMDKYKFKWHKHKNR